MSMAEDLMKHRVALDTLQSDIERIAAFLDGMATIAPDGVPTLNIRNYAISANQLVYSVEELITETNNMASEAERGGDDD